jgi:endoglucanase
LASTTTHRGRTVTIIVAALVVVALLAVWIVTTVLPGIGQRNPLADQTFYVYPESSAAVAADTETGDAAEAAATIAKTPAAIWLLPEVHTTADISAFVDGVAQDAEAAGNMPVFVVYGIPERDCNNQSAGGLSAEEYPAWVSAIGAGLVGHLSVVILEPDALALADECGNVDERIGQLQDAASRLAEADIMLGAEGPSIYLDAGHSNWGPAADMASLLQRAGIEKVQGFATNVSNFNTTDEERAWDEQVSDLVGGAHYIIDTSRNGNGSNGDWCNPPGRALGDAPTPITDGTGHDANLWIKNPGESDGDCNGAPAAGSWWNAGAVALVNG